MIFIETEFEYPINTELSYPIDEIKDRPLEISTILAAIEGAARMALRGTGIIAREIYIDKFSIEQKNSNLNVSIKHRLKCTCAEDITEEWLFKNLGIRI